MNFLWTIYPLELVHFILPPTNKHKWKCTIYASQIFTFVISFQNLWQEFKCLFRFANGVAFHHLSSAIMWSYGHSVSCQKFSDNTSHTPSFAPCKNPPKSFISKNAKILHIHRSLLKKLNGTANISIQLYR
jgi:hypothetical protein